MTGEVLSLSQARRLRGLPPSAPRPTARPAIGDRVTVLTAHPRPTDGLLLGITRSPCGRPLYHIQGDNGRAYGCRLDEIAWVEPMADPTDPGGESA